MQLILNTKDYMIIDISAELGVGFGKEGTQGRAKYLSPPKLVGKDKKGSDK